MVIYPDGVWYHYETLADVDEILQRHVAGGRPVERLMLRPEDGPFRS
jgi:(2Fe-2S) ferredoxin